MKEYIVEYSFGENDKIERIVESEDDNLELIMLNNTSGEGTMFTDKRGHLCSFKFSNVKYTKVYPNTRAKITNKPSYL